MGSETEINKELEVKKAHTRTRSKQKQDKEDGSTSLDVTSESVAARVERTDIADSISNGTAKKGRPRRARGPSDDRERTTKIEISGKTRHAKRTANSKASIRDENDLRDSTSKRVKKDGAAVDEKDESVDTEEGNDDPKKPKKPSKRRLKKEKAEQRETLKKEASRLEATERALNYVSKWKHARSEWKFEKLRQIWLMDNLLDDNAIPDEIFPTVLEYFEGCKGMAREQLLKKGMDVIRKQEENEEEAATTTSEETEKSIEYKRARQLLQALPTET